MAYYYLLMEKKSRSLLTNMDEEKGFMYNECMRIMDALNNDDTIAMLNETQIILRIIPDDIKFDKLEKDISKILQDDKTMRILHLMKKIKAEVETAIEYYYIDRGRDERLFYQEDLEKKLNKLKEEIRIAISIILKNYGGIELG